MVPKKYGEGVADNEAMPYVTGMLSKVGMPFTILASTDTALNRCWPHWRVEWRMPSYLFLPNILFARRFPIIFREFQGLSVGFHTHHDIVNPTMDVLFIKETSIL